MKKGIMLPFVATIILALMLFIPLTLWASKLFRLSGQAEESFEKLTIDLKEIAYDGDLNEIRTRVLIMDAKTFIAAFKDEGGRVLINNFYQTFSLPDSEIPIESNVDYYFEYPRDHCQGNTACLCLCQEYEDGKSNTRESPGDAGQIIQEGDVAYICSNLYCKNLEKVELTENFGISRADKDKPGRVQLKLQKTSTGKISIT